jgi:PIN domain nuclease of toxin-antitoxin system
VIVLDAYAVIAYLADEPAASDVEPLLLDRNSHPSITAVNYAECLDVLTRVHAKPGEEVRERLGWLEVGGLAIVPVDRELALLAGDLRARSYDRRERPVTMADCVALALAKREGAPVATADPHLALAATDEGVDVIPLPDSRGVRPRVIEQKE